MPPPQKGVIVPIEDPLWIFRPNPNDVFIPKPPDPKEGKIIVTTELDFVRIGGVNFEITHPSFSYEGVTSFGFPSPGVKGIAEVVAPYSSTKYRVKINDIRYTLAEQQVLHDIFSTYANFKLVLADNCKMFVKVKDIDSFALIDKAAVRAVNPNGPSDSTIYTTNFTRDAVIYLPKNTTSSVTVSNPNYYGSTFAVTTNSFGVQSKTVYLKKK